MKFSIIDGLNLQLSLVKPAFVHLFWGAEIDEFYKEIQHPWLVLHSRIQEGLFLSEKKLGVTYYLERYRFTAEQKQFCCVYTH
jgi:hypothetical protein